MERQTTEILDYFNNTAPAGGWRQGVSINDLPDYGGYWSSTNDNYDARYSNYLIFNTSVCNAWSSDWRYKGHSVRLVRDVN